MSGEIASQVEEKLRTMIVRGELAPAQMLTERELAGRLGVSVTPIHHALVRLEGEGLVRLYPKRGAQVAQLSLDDVSDLREFRILIERYAIETIGKLSPGRRDDLVAELKQCLVDTTMDMDSEAFVSHDAAFHEVLVKAIENQAILDAYVILRTRLQMVRLRKVRRSPELIGRWLAEHSSVVDHLAAGRMDEAGVALLDHIRSATRY